MFDIIINEWVTPKSDNKFKVLPLMKQYLESDHGFE